MGRNTGGNPGDVRKSALWGSGNRGGEHRSNALWGKGGRGFVTTVLVVALAVPLAAGAGSGPGKNEGIVTPGTTYVSAELKQKQKNSPDEVVGVIVQLDDTVSDKDAKRAENELRKLGNRFGIIKGFAGEIRAKDLEKLERINGLVVTADAVIRPQDLISDTLTASTSSQLWTYQTGVSKLWGGPKAPAIAIVDSGIQSRADFAGRIKAEVNFVASGNSAGDGRGHGTVVAGIAAGNAPGYAGAAPNADIVSLDVMDDSGAGRTSDVIAAVEWIYQNKAAYNIRVANFSLHSGAVNHFWLDPLNVAVSKLWHSGVVVVAAAGNYGSATGPSGVPYAPGSNPFVITVGAVDLGGTSWTSDDSRAPWSAYGRTPDGFMKPEICAPGRYMAAPIPMGSTLAQQKAYRLVGYGYIELSGTSFAAPVIAGIAAQVLARNPGWNPDQVKSAVMRRARAVPQSAPRSCGVGQVNAVQTVLATIDTPNPNKALNRFLKQTVNGSTVFDAVSWSDVSWSDVSWDAVSWSDVSWSDVSWDAVSWSDVSWTDVSWSDVSWSDVSWEDNADGEVAPAGDGYVLTPAEAEAAAEDVDLLTPDEKAALAAEAAAAEQAAAEAAAETAAAEEALPAAAPTLP
ncbi:MAG TPA: S8 family serine peptidase [Gaiellaceae bacterium]|nr:S8 family serine peptidase [Gaiellaceae bacterium]